MESILAIIVLVVCVSVVLATVTFIVLEATGTRR